MFPCAPPVTGCRPRLSLAEGRLARDHARLPRSDTDRYAAIAEEFLLEVERM